MFFRVVNFQCIPRILPAPRDRFHHAREWSLIHNVTWSSGGNAFTNIVYGGYTIVIALMLITRCVDAKSRPTLFEKIILSLGTLLFFAAGGLVFASIDQVHPDLHDNAIILGCLSFLVAILFIIDLADPLARMTSHMSQTEGSALSVPTEKHILKKDVSTDTVEPATVTTAAPVYLIEQDHDRYRDPIGPDRVHQDYPDGAMLIGNQGYREHREEPERRSYRREPQRRYFDRDEPERRSTESIVERKILPSAQVPVFAHVRTPEESRRIAGKEIQYLPIRYDLREYRDPGQPRSHHQHHHKPQSKAPPPSYHDNDSFVEDITPSRRSTYVPADKYDNDVVMPIMNPRPRPPPPAKPAAATSPSNSANSSCDGCNCSQRSSPPKKTGGYQQQQQQQQRQVQQPKQQKHHQHQIQQPLRDEPDMPIKPGYVANVAKKWDDRVRSKSQPIIGLNTMV